MCLFSCAVDVCAASRHRLRWGWKMATSLTRLMIKILKVYPFWTQKHFPKYVGFLNPKSFFFCFFWKMFIFVYLASPWAYLFTTSLFFPPRLSPAPTRRSCTLCFGRVKKKKKNRIPYMHSPLDLSFHRVVELLKPPPPSEGKK